MIIYQLDFVKANILPGAMISSASLDAAQRPTGQCSQANDLHSKLCTGILEEVSPGRKRFRGNLQNVNPSSGYEKTTSYYKARDNFYEFNLRYSSKARNRFIPGKVACFGVWHWAAESCSYNNVVSVPSSWLRVVAIRLPRRISASALSSSALW